MADRSSVSGCPNLQAAGQRAIQDILAGQGKKKAISNAGLPYQPGDPNYRRITRAAGKCIFIPSYWCLIVLD